MLDQRPNQAKKTHSNRWKQKMILLQKIFIILLVITTVQTGIGYAEVGEESDLKTVYHVYTDGEYIGDVSNEESIKELEENKLNQVSSDFEQLHLNIGTDLSVIPERVFAVESNDEQVIDTLQSKLYVHATATALVIDGEPILYVKDKATLDKVIRNFKLQSVSEDELNNYEAQPSSTDDLPHLAENETRITNIMLSADLEHATKQVPPDEVLDAEAALAMLQAGGLQNRTYTIVAGDTLASVAEIFDMTVEQLLQLNESYHVQSTLVAGETLTVQKHAPYVEMEVQYDVKSGEHIPFEQVIEKDSSMLKGETTVKQQGVEGKKLVTEHIRKKNGKVLGKSIIKEEVVKEPLEEITVVGTKEIPSVGTGAFAWPAVGGYISSNMGERWGRMHEGIDIAQPSSRAILASDNGVVTAVGAAGTYGNRVVIKHNNGYETLYAHLASMSVQVGQVVSKGTQIGVMGSTGRSTGVHLHFEVRKNGALLNPTTVLK